MRSRKSKISAKFKSRKAQRSSKAVFIAFLNLRWAEEQKELISRHTRKRG